MTQYEAHISKKAKARIKKEYQFHTHAHSMCEIVAILVYVGEQEIGILHYKSKLVHTLSQLKQKQRKFTNNFKGDSFIAYKNSKYSH